MICFRLFAFAFILSLTACGVQGALYLPEKTPANTTVTKKSGQNQVVPAKKKAPRPSVQTGDLEEELANDPFLTMNPEGEYDIRGERGIAQ